MSALIVNGEHATDSTYQALLRPEWAGRSELVEAMWTEYEPFADPAFPEQLGGSFADRFWEMYLGCALRRAGWPLQKKANAAGPDVCARFDHRTVWVEAIAVTRGADNHPDQLPELPKKGAWTYSEDFERKMLLRLTSAIYTKWQQRQRHIEAGRIGADDSYVIAINTCQCDSFVFPSDLPYVVRAVFPIGREQLVYPLDASGRLGEVHRVRKLEASLPRAVGGDSVPTTIFLAPTGLEQFEHLAAVLHSHAGVFRASEPFGVDFSWVLNPKATDPLPESAQLMGAVWEATSKGEDWSLRRRSDKPSDEIVRVL